VTDPSGAVVGDAKVIITNKATGQVINATTNSAGTYASGAMLPGDYVIRVESEGFKTTQIPVTVQVGARSSGNVKLASELRVNTEQATVQGVITTQQMEQIPINGRNFLDLAQLEPGVQIQDGGNFDPTKNGFTGISVGSREGRTTRIEVDGIDITDETVGTTTQNVPLSALQEFQISQSSLDLSTELTGQGAVNITTRSGSNSWHGESFYYFRDHSIAAGLPGRPPFQRNQFGGRLGGPIIKNKLFFFLDGERTKQDQQTSVILPAPFTDSSGAFAAPFRENMLLGRLDWQVTGSARAFVRVSYDEHSELVNYIANTFQPFSNRNNAPVFAGGLDFSTGNFTHSFRGDYLHFRNDISDAVLGSSIFDPLPGVSINIGTDLICLTAGLDSFCSGPNFLAPQATRQANKQFKYDGSWVHQSHVIRYGVDINRITTGGFASFIGTAPEVNAPNCPALPCSQVVGSLPGGNANPLNYSAQIVLLGNGVGFASEIPGFGFPAGSLFDHRLGLYVGDSWKVKPNLTVTYGLRYVRDYGRSNSDLSAIPCSAAATPVPGCTGNLLDAIQPGVGGRIRQPNTNFAPQLGIAWDPKSNGKTVIRLGTGLFYENSVFNNILLDRASRLPKGLLLSDVPACLGGAPVPVTIPGSASPATFPLCGQAVGTSGFADALDALHAQFQAATKAAGPQSNATFVGNTLAEGIPSTFNTLLAPNYRTARSIHFNAGIQREIRPGTLLSVDYVRNVALHFLLATDVNHVGDARFLNAANALAAINATTSGNPLSAGCPLAASAGASSQAAVDCYLAKVSGASIGDFAGNGLDSGVTLTGGFPAPNAAFPGINPNFGQMQMLFPSGRSVYNAVDISFKGNRDKPLPLVRRMNYQVTYSLSRLNSMSGDQDFIANAADFRNLTHFYGPSALDRTHALSFGGTMEFPKGPQLSFAVHFSSAAARTLLLPSAGGAGAIFQTDVDGDGTGAGDETLSQGDILPGTNRGSFGRDVKVSNLNSVITSYDNTFAGTLTPAGQALVSNGLFTQAQLVVLGAVMPTLPLAPKGQVGLDAPKQVDMKFAWPIKVRESLMIEPSVAAFNVFNFARFDPAGQPLSGVLDGSDGSVNGTTNALSGPTARLNRIGLGSGVFALGAPRILEFGLRLTF